MTASIPQTRPKFSEPPVNEVAASIHFEPLDAKQMALFVQLLWDCIGRERYINMEFKIELPKADAMPFKIEALNNDSPYSFPRYWFESENKADVVQVSNSKISFNWRKLNLADTNKYKAFEHVWGSFKAAIDALKAFSSQLETGDITPTQFELVYFNNIKLEDFGGTLKGIDSLYPSMSFLKNAPWLEEPNAFNFLWNIPDAKTKRNLLIQSMTGMEVETGCPVVRLELVARAPAEEGKTSDDDLYNWFNESHLMIVNTFTALTSSNIQTTKWGAEK